MFGIFFSSLVATLLAEVIGDKTLYTAGALAGIHRPGPVALGAGAAAALKMAVAVVAGGLLAGLPAWLLTTVGVLTWGGIAIGVWRRRTLVESKAELVSGPRLAGTSFAAVFFTEWGDPGQLVAGVLAAQTGEPVIVWAASTTAMIVKIVAGIGFVRVLGKRLAPSSLRIAGIAMFLGFGAMTLFGVEG